MNPIQLLLQQVSRMQWTDYLDILIVAAIIYKTLPMLRSRATMRIVLVFFGVLIIAGLTNLLNLYSLQFIINKFMAVGVLAMVILFQPELRRVLDHLGSIRIRSFLATGKADISMEGVISQTVEACEVMSNDRVGALMVFTRNGTLEDIYRTGTPVDAQVSAQLIRNIFFPKAALHDGAMLIRDGRLAAAGCVLPLSDSNRLSADLGTRHRAGVGMSEVSDAVVVIVSEETGNISVAVGGILKSQLTPSELDRMLHLELCPGEKDVSVGAAQSVIKKASRFFKEAAENED